MPRGVKSRRGAAGVLEADVRLTDYAHASLASADSGRISKKAVNAAVKTIRETRHWWECDEDDFTENLALPCDHHQPEDEGDSASTDSVCHGSRNRGKILTLLSATKRDPESVHYPTDLWFLISGYIRPEDVGRFALICRATYNVTRSSSFWRQLYRRFFDSKLTNIVPEPFQPLALTRPYGLRTRVIKALFCSYGNFMERTRIPNGVSLSTAAVAKLYRGVCESTWWEHQQDSSSGKSIWKFYFKFRGRQSSLPRPGRKVARSCQYASHNALLDYLDDIWANLEDECCILKVTCNQYTQIPTVLGWHLSDLNISLCSDMRSHRLRLVFSESASRSKLTKTGGASEVALLDSVQTVAVFDWFHPNYPSAVL